MYNQSALRLKHQAISTHMLTKHLWYSVPFHIKILHFRYCLLQQYAMVHVFGGNQTRNYSEGRTNSKIGLHEFDRLTKFIKDTNPFLFHIGSVFSQAPLVSEIGKPALWCFSLRPSDAIWQHRSGSTLAQVMDCCLTAPSHYLNQCWLIISKV